MQCFKCGVSGEKAELYDAISPSGIIKVCERCAFNEHLPLLRKPAKKIFIAQKPILPKDISVRMGNDSKTMYDRLSRLSGVHMTQKKPEDIELIKQNRVLRDVANRNFRDQLHREKGDTSEMVDDFKWIMMRARRRMHISTNQLAEAIAEPEAAIRMAEQGVLPKNAVPFMKKIENHLNVRLLKQGVSQQSPRLGGNFSVKDSSLKISDMKTMDVPQPEEEEIPEDLKAEFEGDEDDVDARDILFKN